MQLRRNVIANFLGQGWSGLMSVLFVPVYIRLLGIEAYGLIGLYVSLQAFYFILDAGMSSTLNRALARHVEAGPGTDRVRDQARTLEWLYWPMGLFIFGLTLAASLPIARHWLHPAAFTEMQVARAIALMGLALALQWPSTLYTGGFRGLERQVALNCLNAAFVTARSAGVIPILYFVAPTIDAFLWWQVGVGAVQTAVMATVFWRILPPGSRPSFRRERLAEVAHFTGGMAGISILGFLLANADRIILSRVLPLDRFGYYALAATAAAVLAPVVQSFFNAFYPRFSRLLAGSGEAAVEALYHTGSQLLTVVVASVAAVLSVFASETLLIWSGDPRLAGNSGPILALLVVGFAINGLVTLPYALQLAHGWTRLTLIQNSIAVLLMLPATWWLAGHYGGIGVAAAWIVLNLGFLVVGVPLMHRRLLPGQFGRWLVRDILPPAAGAVLVALAARALVPSLPTGAAGVAWLAAIGGATLLVSALCAPACRAYLRERFSHPAGSPRT
jgi:O-antigen/teichoic acid export membrane protein